MLPRALRRNLSYVTFVPLYHLTNTDARSKLILVPPPVAGFDQSISTVVTADICGKYGKVM